MDKLLTRRNGLVLAGIVLLSFNLRPTAVSVGPVLAEVTHGLRMSHVTAGLLTSLPVLAFACFGAVSPWLARRVGVHRVTLLALACVVVGLGGRAVAGGSATFLALSMLALAGMAAANVLLPSLVKLHFPDRVGRVTSLYTTALAVGLTSALMLTVPISRLTGSWRGGLGAWAVLGLLAALPWLGLVGHDRGLPPAAHDVRLADAARTRLGVAMALFFGLQSLQAYVIFGWFDQLWRDHGFSPTDAGFLVGLVGLTSIPMSFWLPAYLAHRADPRPAVLAVIALYPVGYVGLLLSPHTWAVVWAVVIGVATATFPMILVLIGLRSRTPSGTAALSGVTQSAGYLVAAAGPFSIGLIYDATGGWTWPLWFLIGLTVPMLGLGSYVARPVFVEDQLRARA